MCFTLLPCSAFTLTFFCYFVICFPLYSSPLCKDRYLHLYMQLGIFSFTPHSPFSTPLLRQCSAVLQTKLTHYLSPEARYRTHRGDQFSLSTQLCLYISFSGVSVCAVLPLHLSSSDLRFPKIGLSPAIGDCTPPYPYVAQAITCSFPLPKLLLLFFGFGPSGSRSSASSCSMCKGIGADAARSMISSSTG